jgi:hypothetical protein
MALRIPTQDDLQRLAQHNYFTLSHDEAKAYHHFDLLQIAIY